jgi:hypothetical protein
MLAGILLLAAGLAVSAAAEEQPRLWLEGDLFHEEQYPDVGVRPTRLTHGRRVTEYRLSPDRKSIATIENLDGKLLYAPLEEVEPEEVAILTIATGERRVLARSPIADRYTSLFGMRFSPDGGRLYFHSACAVVAPCVHAVDLGDGSPVKVSGGQILDIIDAGPYRGHLVVQQHRYQTEGGSFEEAVLLAPDGEEVFDIGSAEDEALLRTFAEAIRRPANPDGTHPAQAILQPISPDPARTVAPTPSVTAGNGPPGPP